LEHAVLVVLVLDTLDEAARLLAVVKVRWHDRHHLFDLRTASIRAHAFRIFPVSALSSILVGQPPVDAEAEVPHEFERRTAGPDQHEGPDSFGMSGRVRHREHAAPRVSYQRQPFEAK